MPEIEIYHVVLTTNNRRTSQRMAKMGIKPGKPILLNVEEEIVLTKIIKEIIQYNNYNVMKYNICRDHVHLLLVSQLDEVQGIIQKLKSVSSKLFHRSGQIQSYLPQDHGNHLWSQKFYFAELDM